MSSHVQEAGLQRSPIAAHLPPSTLSVLEELRRRNDEAPKPRSNKSKAKQKR